MFPRVRLHHLKESISLTLYEVSAFFMFFSFALVILWNWLKIFAPVNKWFHTFFVPKLLIVVVGLIATGLPLWLLVPISFLPIRIVGPIFFIAFILMLAQ